MFYPEHACIYLEVNLLGVGGLGGQGPIDPLLVREEGHGGDPGVVRGAHLSQFLQRDCQDFLISQGILSFSSF